jgi:hypothetical protein
MELEHVPDLWLTFCHGLQASDELARQLWDHVKHRDQIRWQLEVLARRAGSLRGATTRTKRLCRILTPTIMMKACIALEPEGHVRSKAIRKVEAHILRLTHQGEWIW